MDFLNNKESLRLVVALIAELHSAFITHNDLDSDETKKVAHDAACVMTRIGMRHIKRWPRDAMRILWRAVCLGRRIPANIYMAGALDFLARRRWPSESTRANQKGQS